MSFLRSWYLKRFFTHLYQTHENQGWAVIAKAPSYLNVALPDFSVQYIIATFHKKDTILIQGTVPEASYVSLTVYDTSGMPYSWLYLTTKNTDSFQVEIGKELKCPSSDRYALILRVYQSEQAFSYPTIYRNGEKLKPLLKSEIYENTLVITETVKQLLSRNLRLTIRSGKKFFMPIQTQKRGLFINPDAAYLVASPVENGPRHSSVILILGTLPPRTDKRCYVGFMACRLSTTETDDCIGWDQLPLKYRIYVAYSKRHALCHGYHEKTDHLILWKSENDSPIVVYREVNVDSKSDIFQIHSDTWQEAKTKMKSYYPEIIFF